MNLVIELLLIFSSMYANSLQRKANAVNIKFSSMYPLCLPNPGMEKIYVQSETRCARHCISNMGEPCNTFIWNRIGKTCMTFEGIRRSVEAMTSEVEIYNVNKEGCTNKGYYYDPNVNTCLKMYEYQSNPKTWNKARQHCQDNGGDLISLTSKEKWDFALNFTSCKPGMWIGLKGEQWMTNQTFENIYRVNLQLNYYDALYASDPEADCVRFDSTSNFVLSDFNCNSRRRPRYLCEIIMP